MKTLYKTYENKKALGVFTLSNFGGIEILDILHGIDDYAVACFNFGTGRQQIRKHKIYYTAMYRPYIRKQGTRYNLDEILRA